MRSVLGLLFGIGMIWLAISWDTSQDERAVELHETGARASGSVVEVQAYERTRRTGGRRPRTEEYTKHCPRVAWWLDGREHTFVEFDDCDRLEVGDEVTVMYDVADPHAARLATEAVVEQQGENRRVAWSLVGLGGLFVVGSVLGLVLRVRAARARSRS